ncbi:hypothetical protein HRbin09_01748 [bacterium HR09]|nr:hypothetical protein HRbin09_01748 [bacterium HR09]
MDNPLFMEILKSAENIFRHTYYLVDRKGPLGEALFEGTAWDPFHGYSQP